MNDPSPPISSLRTLPSVDRMLRELAGSPLPREALAAVVRRELDAARQQIQQGGAAAAGPIDFVARVRRPVDDLCRSRLGVVVNGTGILLHTNFGRAPIGARAIRAVSQVAARYNTLEYDLSRGARGSRAAYVEHNLSVLCGAEAATVVNNCAAALILILRQLTRKKPRREVVISRGELVQIGGGFRVPDVLRAAGARLREVGTTNRTTAADYASAITERTALLLRVHPSNFYQGGFVAAPETAALAAVAREHGVPLVVDLGSGAFFPTESLSAGPAGESAEREPTPPQVLAAGADLVCFSGDKLMGGPQAGVIAGRADRVAALKAEPFFRALRCDKMVLAALQETVDVHLERRGAGPQPGDAELPFLTMASLPLEGLRRRAERLAEALGDAPIRARVGEAHAQVGGGSLPRTRIPSVTLDLEPTGFSIDALAAALRQHAVPVIGYAEAGRYRLDLRTIFEDQDDEVVRAIRLAVTRLTETRAH